MLHAHVAALLSQARQERARELSAYDLADPPKGYEKAPKSKKGAYRKKLANGRWAYWYDPEATAPVQPTQTPQGTVKPKKSAGQKPPGKREQARQASQAGGQSLAQMVGRAKDGGEVDLDEAARLAAQVSGKELLALVRSLGPLKSPAARDASSLRRVLVSRLAAARKVSLPPAARGFVEDALENPGEDTLLIFADYLEDNDRPVAAAKLRKAFEMYEATLQPDSIEPGRNSFPIWREATLLPPPTARFVQTMSVANARLPDGSRVWSHLSDEVRALVTASRLVWAGAMSEEEFGGVLEKAKARVIRAEENIGYFNEGADQDRRHLRHVADQTVFDIAARPESFANWHGLARATVRDWPESFPAGESVSWDDLEFVRDMSAKVEKLTGIARGG